MPTYKAPLDEIRFLLHDVHNIGQLAELPGYAEATPEIIDAVLAEGAAFCETVLFPLNQNGDAEECRFEGGEVKTPSGFREAFRQYAEGGWTGLAASPEYGGLGLPEAVRFVMEELLCSSNLSFSMYPGLAHGAYTALDTYGSDELKALYLPRLVDGRWAGTMCLTEPQAGTDLGIITTKATPNEDGTYSINGTKIFITAGEHDLTENIVHLVLARLPDAPSGTRGISLFIVPKHLPQGDSIAPDRNGVTCSGIEHKMGIKGSATCTINFEDAKGWIVGEPHKGMRAMFVMMNGARLAVGMQGLGLAEVAYQNSLAYAKERLQGRALTGPVNTSGVADPILVHPDVRKGLLHQKAFNEGMRSLAYWVGIQIDIAHHHADAARREEADDMVQLMTPVIKSFLTDVGFANTNLALQTLGGHGYIRESGLEQYVRDARIAQIYEGTNGIQALDLVGRKLGMEGGRLVRRFFQLVRSDVEAGMADEDLTEFAGPVSDALKRLQKATMFVAERGSANPNEAAAAAGEYLRIMGYCAVAWQWLLMVSAARKKVASGSAPQSLQDSKERTARYFMQRLLPESEGLLAAVQSGASVIMAFNESDF